MTDTVQHGGAGTGDDGQMMTPLVIFLGFTVLAYLTIALVPVGAATNERSRSQTAADAAALAGAEEIRTTWVYSITFPGVLTYPAGPLPGAVNPGSGSSSATSYAAGNGSHVISYRVSPARGQVYTKVESNSSAYPENGRALSEATAEMAAGFSGCLWDNPVPPTPLPYGPATFERTLTCGAWQASYVLGNVSTGAIYPTLAYAAGDAPDDLFHDLEPRLVD